MTDWKLARIRSTHLGPEDHGILTFFLHLEYADPGEKIGGTGQGFGGWGLGGEFAHYCLEGILAAVGVDDWSKIPGRMVWADAEWTKVHAIRGVDTGKEFRPSEWEQPGDEVAA